MDSSDDTLPQHCQRIQSCVNYRAYQFALPRGLSERAYTQLQQYMLSLGENRNPPELKVLHIKHEDFFIDFPAQGFPYFKVSFYPHTPNHALHNYLTQFNEQLVLRQNTLDGVLEHASQS